MMAVLYIFNTFTKTFTKNGNFIVAAVTMQWYKTS